VSTNLWDFQNPDLTWNPRDLPREVGHDAKGLIFEVGFGRDARRFRVYATHGSTRGLFLYGGHVWRCTHRLRKSFDMLGIKRGDVCNYFPGTEESPPLPGQMCHSCGRPRSEWVPRPTPMYVHGYAYGPKWITHPDPFKSGHNFVMRGLFIREVE
jgi:hypothetical protein